MNFASPTFTRAALCLAALLPCVSARANDSIFPPTTPAAAAAISFDGKGFLIGGKRAFITSGSMHYARVPRALWRDRLLKMKQGGFNTVQTYIFWNYHEPKDGQFDFSGEKDLGAFLDLVHEMGMYATVRVGPYYCAEWDSGGYPVWLRFKPGVRVREDNHVFLQYVDRFFEHLLPIVAARQVHKGGAVILVQLENEHPQSWGTDIPNGYFQHLLDKARALGIEVPTFFSGLHHSSDPAGSRPWDSAGRNSPWMSTEFWAGWFDLGGPMSDQKTRYYTRGLWKLIAFGGNGYNDYMLHGGTNFAYWNNNEDDASYDYGAAIGQAGDLRPLYYNFKRANWFARSFADILENSTNASSEFSSYAMGAPVYARKSPVGTIVFLDNSGSSPATLRIHGGDPIPLDAGEIFPIVRDYTLSPSIRIEESVARILGIARNGDTTTLVVYGPPGDEGSIRFRITPGTAFGTGAPAFTPDPSDPTALTIRLRFPADAPEEYMYTTKGERLRVLAMSTQAADRTWFPAWNGQQYVVTGPEFLTDFGEDGKGFYVRMERPVGSATRTATVYGRMDDVRRLEASVTGPAPSVAPPALSAWEARAGDAEAAPDFDDAGWMASDSPQQMGADGDISAYAWYRATIPVAQAGTYQVNFTGAADRARVYVNGRSIGTGASARVDLNAGDNSLAVFTAHDGRDKLAGYLGPLLPVSGKGLLGPVTLSPAPSTTASLNAWRWKAVTAGAEMDAAVQDTVDTSGSPWQSTDSIRDVFNGRRGFVVYRAVLPTLAGRHREIRFDNIDDNGTVYLNGQKIGVHTGWGQPFALSLDAAWRPDGPNNLAVAVENTDGPGGIMGSVTLQGYDGPTGATNGTEVRGWKMRGGIGPENPDAGWQPFSAATGRPAFYRAHFTLPEMPAGVQPVYRVATTGLSRGFMWVNGHNLGRCPDRLVDSLYVPECWLNAGDNTLIVFDEDGRAPTSVRLTVETASTRQALELGAPA